MSIPLPIINYLRRQYTLGSRHPDPFLQPPLCNERQIKMLIDIPMNIDKRLRGSIAALQTFDLIAKYKLFASARICVYLSPMH